MLLSLWAARAYEREKRRDAAVRNNRVLHVLITLCKVGQGRSRGRLHANVDNLRLADLTARIEPLTDYRHDILDLLP